jgi:hypothetical protein
MIREAAVGMVITGCRDLVLTQAPHRLMRWLTSSRARAGGPCCQQDASTCVAGWMRLSQRRASVGSILMHIRLLV